MDLPAVHIYIYIYIYSDISFGDKCFDKQEKSVPHNKVKKTHNKVPKKHNKVLNTQTGNTIKTKGLGLV